MPNDNFTQQAYMSWKPNVKKGVGSTTHLVNNTTSD